MTARKYHHGDLHAALIAAGMTLVAERPADLSLREVARSVGVSATAVYRHFPDKDALMMALAIEGLRLLAIAQRAASNAAGGGMAGFNATGAAYVHFALAHPALFRLIFAHPAPTDMLSEPIEDAEDAMAMLRRSAEALAPPGVDPQMFALQSWSVAHGLAMLILDGKVTIDDAAIETVLNMAVTRRCVVG